MRSRGVTVCEGQGCQPQGTTIDVEAIRRMAGREAGELSRRDVARALLSGPYDEVIDALPELRRQLIAAGNPLSEAFWNSAEEVLEAVAFGSATFGQVRRWLEATGTEPAEMIGWFLWPDEEDRGPVAEEMHTRLVTFLEEAVEAGTVDPDRLLSGDETALADHQALQESWLHQPLADGRVPAEVIEGEEVDAWEAEWDEARSEVRQILTGILDGVGDRPLPEDELGKVCARLRRELPQGGWLFDLVATAGGVDPAALPEDDTELWLTLAAGVVECEGELPLEENEDGEIEDPMGLMSWFTLELWDWIGAVGALAHAGPGAHVDAATLARWALTFDPEGDGSGGEQLDFGLADWDDNHQALEVGFGVVILMWQVLGVVDRDERLTRLGWWGAPEALLRVWRPRSGLD